MLFCQNCIKESSERRTVISENQGVMEWVTCPGIREGKYFFCNCQKFDCITDISLGAPINYYNLLVNVPRSQKPIPFYFYLPPTKRFFFIKYIERSKILPPSRRLSTYKLLLKLSLETEFWFQYKINYQNEKDRFLLKLSKVWWEKYRSSYGRSTEWSE